VQDLGVAYFRARFGHFLVKSWFFDYIITMSIQKWTFSSYMNLIMMMKCRTIGKFENFLHFRAGNTHLSAIGSDQQSQKRSWHAQPKRDFYLLLTSMSSWNNYFDAVKKEKHQIKSLFHRRSLNFLDSFFLFWHFCQFFKFFQILEKIKIFQNNFLPPWLCHNKGMKCAKFHYKIP
jgi:hypothetical protein